MCKMRFKACNPKYHDTAKISQKTCKQGLKTTEQIQPWMVGWLSSQSSCLYFFCVFCQCFYFLCNLKLIFSNNLNNRKKSPHRSNKFIVPLNIRWNIWWNYFRDIHHLLHVLSELHHHLVQEYGVFSARLFLQTCISWAIIWRSWFPITDSPPRSMVSRQYAHSCERCRYLQLKCSASDGDNDL